MRVSVYFNLHRKCFSIRAEEGPEKGRVLAHADNLGLRSVTMSVGQAGNRKVRETGKKNVHAFMRGLLDWQDGTLTEAGERHCDAFGHAHGWAGSVYIKQTLKQTQESGVRISYDPYRDTSFVCPEVSRLPVRGAWVVTMTKNKGAYGVGVTA